MFGEADKINSVVGNICAHLGVEAKDEKTRAAFRLCIKMAVRQLTSAQFSTEIKKLFGFAIPLPFRTGLSQNVYFLRNFRAFVVAVSEGKKANIDKLAAYYEIAEEDQKFAKRCYHTIRDIALSDAIAINVMDVKALDANLATIIPELQRHCMNKVKKKLFFVASSCNYEFQDLVNELLCKAIVGFYELSISGKESLHVMNSLRTACSNQALNMIKYFNAQKRSRLVKNGNSFTLTIVSENQASTSTDDSLNYENLLITDTTNSMILGISVNQILTKIKERIALGKNVRMNRKKLKFMTLLMGSHDEGFTDYLNSIGIRFANDDYQDRVQPKRYIELISRYLEITKEVSRNFLSTLRVSLT